MANAKPVLVASHEIHSYSRGTYDNVRVEVEYPDGRVWDDPLRGLCITAQQGSDDASMPVMIERSYGWRVEFRYGWTAIDLPNVERMAKVLRSIHASLERQSDRLGAPLDFAQYVLRVAAALKVDTIEVKGGWSSNLSGAADQIRGWERDFAAKYAPAAQAD